MSKIYKFTYHCDHSIYIEYNTDKSVFEEKIVEWIEEGMGVADDTIEEISFDNAEELCKKLNKLREEESAVVR